MNKWVKNSVDSVRSKGYLDNLFEIYPIELGTSRNVPGDLKSKIEKAFNGKNEINLIQELLRLSKFPIDDPYIASLRRAPFLLNKNPKTIERLGKRLFSMGLRNLLKLATQPKSPSRQFGHTFKNWLKTLDYPFLLEREFLKTKREIVFLKGGDTVLKNFAIRNFKIKRLDKGLDFVLRVKDKFILGEAKFLTSYGGTQDNQFNYAVKVSKIKKDKIIGIAVLDGVCWFEGKTHMYKTIKKLKGTALSALLLKKFIKGLRRV